MRINESNMFRVDRVSRVDHVHKARPGAKSSSPASESTDSVSFSSEAKTMALAEQRLAQVPDIRVDKVEALKKAIASGTYRVSAQAIADAILREHKES